MRSVSSSSTTRILVFFSESTTASLSLCKQFHIFPGHPYQPAGVSGHGWLAHGANRKLLYLLLGPCSGRVLCHLSRKSMINEILLGGVCRYIFKLGAWNPIYNVTYGMLYIFTTVPYAGYPVSEFPDGVMVRACIALWLAFFGGFPMLALFQIRILCIRVLVWWAIFGYVDSGHLVWGCPNIKQKGVYVVWLMRLLFFSDIQGQSRPQAPVPELPKKHRWPRGRTVAPGPVRRVLFR